MAEKIRVKLTRDDLVVYDQASQRIPIEGKVVPKTPFYIRLINDGALSIVREKTKKAGE